MDSPTVPTSLLLQIVNIYITTFIAGLQTIFARKEIFFISYGFLMKEFHQETRVLRRLMQNLIKTFRRVLSSSIII